MSFNLGNVHYSETWSLELAGHCGNSQVVEVQGLRDFAGFRLKTRFGQVSQETSLRIHLLRRYDWTLQTYITSVSNHCTSEGASGFAGICCHVQPNALSFKDIVDSAEQAYFQVDGSCRSYGSAPMTLRPMRLSCVASTILHRLSLFPQLVHCFEDPLGSSFDQCTLIGCD